MTSKNFSNIHQKRYDWLYNYLKTKKPNIEKSDFIKKINQRELVKLIKDNASWSDSSKESIYFMIARWYEVHDPSNINIPMFKQLGYDLKKKKDDIEGENKLDSKEEGNFQNHSFFKNLLDNIKIDEISTISEHYKYLLLALLTLQPPLRTSFYTSAKFITKEKDNDNKNNFLLLITQGRKRVYYIVNKDKASNYKEYAKNKNLSQIEIEDEKLIKIIYDSYEKYPRTYLFENDKKPMSQQTLLNNLRKVTGIKGLTVDMMRSIYITDYHDNNPTYKQRDKLAKQMRHSYATASKNYRKIVDVMKSVNTDEQVTALQKENDKLKAEILELKQKLTKYEPDDKLYAKRRSSVLYNLNSGKAQPKQETLNEYKITYDVVNKKYV